MRISTQKIVISSIIIIVLFFVAVFAMMNQREVEVRAADELAVNGTFESNEVAPWQAFDGTQLTAIAPGHESEYCMEISARPNVWNVPLQAINNKLQAEGTYMVSAWIKSDTAGEYAIALEEPWSADGYDICQTANIAVPAGEWTQISGSITLVSGFNPASANFLVKRPSDTGTYCIDDVSLQLDETVTPKPASPSPSFVPEADPYLIPDENAQPF
ncbi:MAG: carbohydrate binding domain-containing protein, partial [Lachnoclostridium sp.]|nr:carbohydrate binding domain-containing protein [Lachnoclostridium sp.]